MLAEPGYSQNSRYLKALNVKNFPIGLFTSVMGVGGLSIAYQRFSDIFSMPLVGLGLLCVTYLLFAVIGLIYLCKLAFFRADAAAEFNHPVKANFFAAVSISLLVLSIGTIGLHRQAALVLWCAGAALHLAILLTLASRWITRDYEITQLNPAWFLPAAGNLLVPIVGVEIAPQSLSWFFFSIGIFLWLILFVVIFYRLTFHRQLIDKFVPTLFILIAPPALGFISYVKLTGEFDVIAHLLLNVTLFLTLLLLFILPYCLKVRFSVSWWAFTFPLCIATSAVVLAYKLSGLAELAWISAFLLALASAAVVIVAVKTALALRKGSLFED